LKSGFGALCALLLWECSQALAESFGRDQGPLRGCVQAPQRTAGL